MYLSAEVFIGGSYHKIEPEKIEVSSRFKETNDQSPEQWEPYPTEDIDSITYQVGYWRKANQIHGWFVDNVQHGEDDCRYHDVSEEQLEKLQSICVELLQSRDKEKALELLPVRKGFFFGRYNPKEDGFWEDYWYDLETTVKAVTKALEYISRFRADIKYRSSW